MKSRLPFVFAAAAMISLAGCGRDSASQRTAQAKKDVSPAQAAQAQPALPPFAAVAAVDEIMAAEVMPSAGALWNSVATISDKTGFHVHEPETDAQWEALRLQALILVESTNLLMIKGRKATAEAEPDEPGALGGAAVQHLIDTNWSSFVTDAQGLHDIAMVMLHDVQAKDVKGLYHDGGTLDQVCESCHLEFWYPDQTNQKK